VRPAGGGGGCEKLQKRSGQGEWSGHSIGGRDGMGMDRKRPQASAK